MATAEPKMTPRVEQEETLLEWRAPARPFKKRNGQFLTIPMVIAILVGIILLLAGEWIMIAVVAALVFAYYVWSTVPPEDVDFAITSRGVRINKQLYAWEVMSRWWMDEKWDQKLLMIESPVAMGGRLVMPLGGEDQIKVEKVMKDNLLMEKPEATWMEKGAKWLEEKFPLETKI